MSLDWLNNTHLPRQIYGTNYAALEKYTIKLDDIFQNYFKKSLIEYIIFKFFSLVNSEKKTTFKVWRNLKEPPSFLRLCCKE